MPALVFLVWGVPLGLVIRRIVFWRRVGQGRHAQRLHRAVSRGVAAAVLLCMGTQTLLLWRMGLAGVATVLPLHLCSFMGVLTPFMLLGKSLGLLEFALFLGAPGALGALLFPAVLPSPWPGLMRWSFFSLHALLVLAPFLRMAGGDRPRPLGAGRVFLWGNMLLGGVAGINALLGTNYFFLRDAPTGTPLAALQGMGQGAYIAALEAGALLLLKAESLALRRWLPRA